MPTNRITANITTNSNTSLPISTNNRCGPSYGICPSGQCCSKYGWCGKTDDYCDSGCQSEFGQCKNYPINNATANNAPADNAPVNNMTVETSIPISTNGRCGKTYGRCPSDECCSVFGWCGKTDTYCGSGCQSEFGKCK